MKIAAEISLRRAKCSDEEYGSASDDGGDSDYDSKPKSKAKVTGPTRPTKVRMNEYMDWSTDGCACTPGMSKSPIYGCKNGFRLPCLRQQTAAANKSAKVITKSAVKITASGRQWSERCIYN